MSNCIPRTKNNEITVDNAMNMNSQCAAAANTGGRNGKSLLGNEWEGDISWQNDFWKVLVGVLGGLTQKNAAVHHVCSISVALLSHSWSTVQTDWKTGVHWEEWGVHAALNSCAGWVEMA